MRKEYRGDWFLPGKQDVKLPGILEIDTLTSSIILKLYSGIDLLGDKITPERDDILYPEIILGSVQDLPKEVTLYSNNGQGGSPLLPNYINNNHCELIYKPRFVFVGAHFSSKDDIQLKNCSFRYTYVGDWIDCMRRFFKKEWKDDLLIVSYKEIPNLELNISTNCRLKIKRQCWHKGEYTSEHKMSVKHFIEFEFDTPQPLQEFYNLSEKLQTFLLFAIGVPVESIESYSEIERNHKLNIYNSFTRERSESKWIHPNEMSISARYFDDETLKKYLLNWFQFYDEFQAVFDTFSHVVRPYWRGGNVTVTNIEFSNGILNIVQAIETFYTKQFKKKLELIKKILFFMNLLDSALIGFIDKGSFDEFAKNLKDCRNDLSHIKHINSKDIQEKYELPHLFYHSQILFYSMTLHKIGIDQSEINSILRRSRKFSRYYKNIA